MKRLLILLFFSLMMPPCHEPGTSMAQQSDCHAEDQIGNYRNAGFCGDPVQVARLSPAMLGSVPAAPASITITYVASASTPVDNGTQVGAGPITVSFPAGIASGDLLILIGVCRAVTDGTVTIANEGNQSWSSAIDINSTTSRRIFWAVYNGNGGTAPTIQTAGSTEGLSGIMHAFNPSSSGTWAVDVGISGNASSAADPVIATGITTLTDGALVIGHFYCPTGSPPITYSALTELWTAIGGAYYRNLGGADMTIATVYRVFASHGATGNISYDKSNNYDTSEWAILAFKCTP